MLNETLVNSRFSAYKKRMSARIKDRQRQIPGGFKFYQPETGWKAPRFASFQVIVNALITHRKGNKAMLAKHGWSIDPKEVASEVDAFNAKVCINMGWFDYVAMTGEDAPPPKLDPQHQSAPSAAGVSNMVGGAQALLEMFGPGKQPVDSNLAEQRAAICSACPKNDKGDWMRYFTEPASLLIRKMLGIVHDLNLKTSKDAELQICSVCMCPLKTKVWAPLDHIRSKLKPELRNHLHEKCWINRE